MIIIMRNKVVVVFVVVGQHNQLVVIKDYECV